MGSKSYSEVTSDNSYHSADSFSTVSEYQADTHNNNSGNTTTSISVTENKDLVSALASANSNLTEIARAASSGLQAFAAQSTEKAGALAEEAGAALSLGASKTSDNSRILIYGALALVAVLLLRGKLKK